MAKKSNKLLNKLALMHQEDMLLVAALLFVCRILLSFSNIGGLFANLLILVGTFCLGLGFYLNGTDNTHTKLSEYGTFLY